MQVFFLKNLSKPLPHYMNLTEAWSALRQCIASELWLFVVTYEWKHHQ